VKVFRFVLAIVLILFAAQAINFRLLSILAYTLLGILVFSLVWAKLSLRWLEITRTSPSERAQVGNSFEELVTLRNKGILPKLWLELHDSSELPNHYPNCVQNLRPLGVVRWKARTLCVLRGRYRLGPIKVTAGDPFGLFRFNREFKNTRFMTVYPATFDINKFEALMGLLPGGNPISQTSYHVTPDISGLRDYRPGDSLNRIHWRSSARQNKLIVKEFEFDPTVNVQIFLDMDASVHWVIDRSSSGAVHGAKLASVSSRSIDSTEEYAVTAAATLVRYYLDNNRSVGLLAWGQEHTVLPPDRGVRQFWKIMEALAIVRAQGSTEFGQFLAAEVTRTRSSDTLILITPSLNESWLNLLPLLLRRGSKVAVVLLEPRTFGAQVEGSMLAVGSLAAMNVPLYLLKRGDDIGMALNSDMAGIRR